MTLSRAPRRWIGLDRISARAHSACSNGVGKTLCRPVARRARTCVALEDVSYSLREGELVSLLGPSGCGKTTLLRIIAGMTRASAAASRSAAAR